MRRRAALPLAVACIALVSGCGRANIVEEQTGSAPADVLVTNCGRTVAPPARLARAVTTEQAPTETLLALGLADRMAGTANIKTGVAPSLQADYRRVPVLSPRFLTPETTLAARPDIVVSSFDSLLTKDTSGTRDELAAKGVATYLWETECPKGTRTIRDAIDAVYADERNLGRLFGVEDRAEKLVADQTKQADAAASRRPAGKAPRLLWLYSAYDGLPYVGGGTGMPDAISRRLGAVNVFHDVADTWPEVQWEQLPARDPDVIVIADLSGRGQPGDRPEEKIRTLRTNPATATMRAVRENRFVVVPGATVDASVRFPEAMKAVSDDLARRGLLR